MLRDTQHGDGNAMGVIARVGADHERGMATRAGPLLDKVDFVAAEFTLPMYDGYAGIVLKVARGCLRTSSLGRRGLGWREGFAGARGIATGSQNT